MPSPLKRILRRRLRVWASGCQIGEAADNAGSASGLPADFFEDGNGRSITPAPPITFYGGLKVKY